MKKRPERNIAIPPSRWAKLLSAWPPAFYALMATRLVSALGFSIVMPFIPIYLNKKLGVPEWQVGIILAMTAVTRAIAQAVGGELSDRFGRKGVLAISCAMRMIGFLAMGFMVMTGAGLVPVTAVILFLFATGALFMPASDALVADVVKPARRVQAYGLMRIATNVGWGTGPAIGGLLVGASYAPMFFVTSGILVVAILIVTFGIHEPKSTLSRDRFKLKDLLAVMNDRTFVYFSLGALFVFLMFSQLFMTFSLYSKNYVGQPENRIGLLYMINGAMVVAFQYWISRISERMRYGQVLALGSLIMAGAYYAMAWADGFGALAILMALATVGEMFATPVVSTIVAGMAPPGRTGRYMGLFGFTNSLAWSMGPAVGGAVMSAFAGYPVRFWGALALFGLVGGIWMFLMTGRIDRRIAETGDKAPGDEN